MSPHPPLPYTLQSIADMQVSAVTNWILVGNMPFLCFQCFIADSSRRAAMTQTPASMAPNAGFGVLQIHTLRDDMRMLVLLWLGVVEKAREQALRNWAPPWDPVCASGYAQSIIYIILFTVH